MVDSHQGKKMAKKVNFSRQSRTKAVGEAVETMRHPPVGNTLINKDSHIALEVSVREGLLFL
jgi:hypothetical protein